MGADTAQQAYIPLFIFCCTSSSSHVDIFQFITNFVYFLSLCICFNLSELPSIHPTAMSILDPAPVLEIIYNFDDESISDKTPTIIKELHSLDPQQTNKVSEDAATSNESFNYSGRHDHGPNAVLKEGGYYAALLAALSEAKEQSNDLLSAEIDRQKEKEETEEGVQKKKKPRINEADAYA